MTDDGATTGPPTTGEGEALATAPPDADDARAALRAAADAENRARALTPLPRWYPPVFGLVVALLPVNTALHGAGRSLAASLVLLVHISALALLDRTSRWLTGARPRRADRHQRAWGWAGIGLLLLAVLGSYAALDRWHAPWLAAALVVTTAVVAAGGTAALDRVWGATRA